MSSPEVVDKAKQDDIIRKELKRQLTCSLVPNQAGLSDARCRVCSHLPKDPVHHTTCGMLFCRSCVEKVPHCPICHHDWDNLIPVPKTTLKMLEEVLVCCDCCKKEMKRSEFKHGHWENCSFDCPLGCGMKVTTKTLVDHCKGGKCSKYEMTCPASESQMPCKWHGPGGEEYASHIAHCPSIQIRPFVECSQREIAELKKTVLDLKKTVVEQIAASEKEKEKMQETIKELRTVVSQQVSASERFCHEVQKTALELKRTITDKASSEQTHNEIGEIQKIVQELKRRICEQATASTRTHERMLELNKSILELKGVVLQQAVVSKQTQTEVGKIPERTVALEQDLVARMYKEQMARAQCCSVNGMRRYERGENHNNVDCSLSIFSTLIPPKKKERTTQTF